MPTILGRSATGGKPVCVLVGTTPAGLLYAQMCGRGDWIRTSDLLTASLGQDTQAGRFTLHASP